MVCGIGGAGGAEGGGDHAGMRVVGSRSAPPTSIGGGATMVAATSGIGGAGGSAGWAPRSLSTEGGAGAAFQAGAAGAFQGGGAGAIGDGAAGAGAGATGMGETGAGGAFQEGAG